MIKVKLIVANILTVLAILLVLEWTAFRILKKDQNQQPFFLNFENLEKKFQPNFYDYEKIDPLLGWDIDKGDVRRNRHIYEVDNLIYFKNSKHDCPTYNILITGGSTTDVTRIHDNWPYYLNEIIQSQEGCYRICHAAVGGYNSGQELLKLIRDGLIVKPDIHISYSGVNEIIPTYVSEYEQTVYDYLLDGTKKYHFLPNTRTWLFKNIVNRDFEITEETVSVEEIPFFWQKNMSIMDAIATENHYKFVGILQPAAGISKAKLPADIQESHQYFIDAYQNYYPDLLNIVDSTEYLWDFTTIFDSIQDHVFVDDCHIHNPVYQKMIAEKVFEIIKNLE